MVPAPTAPAPRGTPSTVPETPDAGPVLNLAMNADTAPVPGAGRSLVTSQRDARRRAQMEGSVELRTGLRDTTLTKGSKGFGFVIKGSAPVAITSIDPQGAAARADLLVGDAIVYVNGEDVSMLPQKEVVALFGSLGTKTIQLAVKNVGHGCGKQVACGLRWLAVAGRHVS